jgi:hypothetical protein
MGEKPVGTGGSWVWADNINDGGSIPRSRNILIPRNRVFYIKVYGTVRNSSSQWAGYRLYNSSYTAGGDLKVNASSFGFSSCTGSAAFISEDDEVQNFKTQTGAFGGGTGYSDDLARDMAEIIFYPSNQSSGFTRQFTQEYEAVARTTNGGRMEYVSDTELQWQPYQHGSIGLYNGLNWEVITPVSNPSAANTVTTISGGALAVDTNYDVYLKYESATSASSRISRMGGRYL